MLTKRQTLQVTRLPLALLLACQMTLPSQSQDAPTYQTPPKALADLVTPPPTPTVSVSDKGTMLLIMEQAAAPEIAELAQPELRLAGLRLNPANHGLSRARYITGLRLKRIGATTDQPVTGLPAQPLISYPRNGRPTKTRIILSGT